jgi:hypothetical protein
MNNEAVSVLAEISDLNSRMLDVRDVDSIGTVVTVKSLMEILSVYTEAAAGAVREHDVAESTKWRSLGMLATVATMSNALVLACDDLKIQGL